MMESLVDPDNYIVYVGSNGSFLKSLSASVKV